MFYCYLLQNTSVRHRNHTYNGFTVDPKRRLRQHNGEIKGGAKLTTSKDPCWEFAVLITGFCDDINALQCEWRIKKPRNKKRGPEYRGIEGRIKGVNEVLHLDQWTSKSTTKNCDMELVVWIKKEFEHLLTDMPDNVNVIGVDKIVIDEL